MYIYMYMYIYIYIYIYVYIYDIYIYMCVCILYTRFEIRNGFLKTKDVENYVSSSIHKKYL